MGKLIAAGMTPALAATLAVMAGGLPVAADPWHKTPGARHFGPEVLTSRKSAMDPHANDPSMLRRILRRYGVTHGLGRPSDFPLVGEERGDRAEIERVMVNTYNLVAGQALPIVREFPVGDPWLMMTLNLRGQLNSVVGPTGTVVSDAPLPLWQLALTTDLDRDIIEPSVSSRAMYRMAQILQGTAGSITAPTLVASTVTNFNAVVQIIFADPRMLVPEDSLLDTRRYNQITLTITTGQLTDIVTAPVNVTLQNVAVDVEVTRLSPRVPLPLDVVKVLPFYKRFAPLTPPNDTFQNLDRVPTLALKRHLSFASSGATAGVAFTGTGDNTVLSTLRISSNRRDHFGNAIGGIPQALIQGDNKADYKAETWPTGWAVADIVLDKSLLSALATGDLSVLQSFFVYQGGLPANPQISTLWNGVQKLRGVKAA